MLQRVHPGTYYFGSGSLSLEQRSLAACLATSDRAFVAAPSAPGLWEIGPSHEGPVHVIVPHNAAYRTTGVIVHRSRSTGRSERTIRGIVPISTVPRTLLDLARMVDQSELERAADAAMRERLVTPQRLLTYLEGRTSRGSGGLRTIAEDRLAHGVHDTDFEKEAERLLLDYGLPRPVRQYRFVANGRRVRFDLAYPEQRVAIEPNGAAPHWGREQWQSDHDKRIAAKIAGINMLEFTWDDVHERALYVVTTVGDALGLKPSRWVRKDPQPP